MESPERISATEARNSFSNLLKESFLEKKSFVVEKGKIPMVFIIPFSKEYLGENGSEKKAQMGLLDDLKNFRGKMGETSDSVKLLREIRKYGLS